jgi:hypothetical protein
MHDHVQVLAALTGIVFPCPDPPAPANSATAPSGDPVAESCKEVVQIALGLGVEVNRVEIERGLESAPDPMGEVLGPDQIPLLGCRDALRLWLSTTIPALPCSPPSLLCPWALPPGAAVPEIDTYQEKYGAAGRHRGRRKARC